ncbi:hypothetical protein D3C78_1317170 [compost metagenome]
MGRQEQDAAVFGAGGGDDVIVVRHHLRQALLILEPDARILQDHGAGLGRGLAGERRAGVAGLGRVGLQSAPVLAGPGVYGKPGQAPDGVRDG